MPGHSCSVGRGCGSVGVRAGAGDWWAGQEECVQTHQSEVLRQHPIYNSISLLHHFARFYLRFLSGSPSGHHFHRSILSQSVTYLCPSESCRPPWHTNLMQIFNFSTTYFWLSAQTYLCTCVIKELLAKCQNIKKIFTKLPQSSVANKLFRISITVPVLNINRSIF